MANMIQVTFINNYKQDHRISMNNYARELSTSLISDFSHAVMVEDFSPRLDLKRAGKWQMRYARYGLYPRALPGVMSGIFHITDHSYGHLIHSLGKATTVVTVHDLIPLLRWKGFFHSEPRGIPPILNLYSLNALRNANHLISVSETTKIDLIKYLGCRPDQITVIHSGVNDSFAPGITGEKRQMIEKKYGLISSKKIIMISGSQFYKNNKTAIKVFSLLNQIDPEGFLFIKIGHHNDEWDSLVMDANLQDHVRTLGVVPQDDLPDLYKSVDIFLFPSLYEGFGWPPLEAMKCGTPVVTSSAGALPEILSPVIPQFDPFDINRFTNEIIHILDDDDYRNKLIKNGRRIAERFDWKTTAQKTLEVYHQVLNSRPC